MMVSLSYGGERAFVVRGTVAARILDKLTPVAEDTLDRIERAIRLSDRELIADAHLQGVPDVSTVVPACARRGKVGTA